ncbi:MAG: amino-acid N-acetyltransferase [Prosthecobacter sp.]|nr:amino-acid N-acetyltransferase [Prosthecobacter sp.]
MPESDSITKPTARFEDLRGILRYVPQFRQRVFVIAIDGALMGQPGFGSILQDVAVLQSLNIEVVLVFGARDQMRTLAAKRGVTLSSDDGMSRTDAATLEIAIEAITRQASELMADLTALELPVVISNALAVHPAGVIDGVDQEHTGRIERVDAEALQVLLRADIIPILPPLGYDGRGATLRLNSDAVAMEVAIALHAAKIIFISEAGLTQPDGSRLAQLSVAEARELFKKKDPRHDVNLLSKLRYGALACQEGVPRVHIVDGTQDEALLAELFSNEGVGAMIHADDYQQIRRARSSDVPALLTMMQQSMEDAALVPRTREQIQARIKDFFVLETDGNPIGSVAVHVYEEEAGRIAELACLFVRRSHKNRGHGQRLVAFAEEVARQRGCGMLVALSTQAFRFFEEKMGFQVTSPDALPAARREKYDRSGRNSKVLIKPLK